MTGLSGSPAKLEAERLADLHSVSWQYIYELTADLRKGKRKKRSDHGKRTYRLTPGSDTWAAAELVINDKLSPDLALLTVQTRNADADLPKLEYFQRLLRENGISRDQIAKARRSHRRFEAQYAGEIFQIDCTALKVRWHDEKTRRVLRIEGIDKNHPQMDPTKLRVWQLMLTDDFSRRKFLRYIVANAVTSAEMVRFESEVFQSFGVPKTLYTDKGSEFRGYHIRAEQIINKILENDGGYRHLRHEAGNAQATGKVENAHKWAEKLDRLVGLAINEGQSVDVDMLNVFADRICDYYNGNVRHRTTGQTPLQRWHSRRTVVRTLPDVILNSALLADDHTPVLQPDMTITFDKVAYKVPGVRPFVDFTGQRVEASIPRDIDWIFLTLPDGSTWEIEKIVAAPDVAGEFKRNAESNAEIITKQLKETRKEKIKAIKEKKRLTGQIAPVPHLNVVIEGDGSNVSNFPQVEREITAAEIAEVVPVLSDHTPPHVIEAPLVIEVPEYRGRDLSYWEAVGAYADRFSDIDTAKEFLLKLYPASDGTVPSLEIEDAINDREKTKLRAVS